MISEAAARSLAPPRRYEEDGFSSVRRSSVNLVVDAIAFCGFVFMTASGVLLRFVLPPGSGHRAMIWGLDRHDWGGVHFWMAVALLGALSVHVLLHWKWIVCVVRGQPREGSAIRLALGIVALLAVLALAAAPLLSRIERAGPARRWGAQTRADDHSMMPKSAGDRRQPLPLPAMMAEHQKQNMRDHLAAVRAIIAAVGRDDMDAVSKGAARLGYSEVMGQMCEHMGAAAPGFAPMALDFHHTADTIGEAARRRDRAGVLSALDRTLQTCVSCHAAYRRKVVDKEAWKRLTAATASPSLKHVNIEICGHRELSPVRRAKRA